MHFEHDQLRQASLLAVMLVCVVCFFVWEEAITNTMTCIDLREIAQRAAYLPTLLWTWDVALAYY